MREFDFFKKCYFDGLSGPPKEIFDVIKMGSKISWDSPFNNFHIIKAIFDSNTVFDIYLQRNGNIKYTVRSLDNILCNERTFYKQNMNFRKLKGTFIVEETFCMEKSSSRIEHVKKHRYKIGYFNHCRSLIHHLQSFQIYL